MRENEKRKNPALLEVAVLGEEAVQRVIGLAEVANKARESICLELAVENTRGVDLANVDLDRGVVGRRDDAVGGIATDL